MSNRSTVSLDIKTAQRIFEEVESLRKSVDILRKRIVKLFPPQYGSDAWWKKEIAEAKKEIKAGQIKELNNLKQLDKPLKNLFT